MPTIRLLRSLISALACGYLVGCDIFGFRALGFLFRFTLALPIFVSACGSGAPGP
jgi:hypothetical protein